MSRKKDGVHSRYYQKIGGKGRRQSSPAINEKIILTNMYTRLLTEMCVNRFEWSGLPDTIDPRFLEMELFTTGLAVFYWDDEFDRYLCLKGAGTGHVNMYDNPTKFLVTGGSAFSKTLDATDCVPIWANLVRVPDLDVVSVYAKRLCEYDLTNEVNMLTLRHPYIVSVPKEQRMSLVNAFNMVQEGQPVIYGTEALKDALDNGLDVHDVGISPETVEKTFTIKSKTWNECLTLLGIVNVNDEKRERMVATEASGSNGHVLAMRNVALNARRMACEAINAKYGLNVTVDWKMEDSASTELPGGSPMATGGALDGDDKGVSEDE